MFKPLVLVLGAVFQVTASISGSMPSASLIQQQLGQQLSPGASIHFPDTDTFANLTWRWSDYTNPSIAIVVTPATDEDVAAAV